MILHTIKGKIKSSHLDAFLTKMHKLIPSVKEEKGCIRYEIYSNPYKPTEIFFYEEWENEFALEEHLAQPKMLKHFEEVQPWFESELVTTKDSINRRLTIAKKKLYDLLSAEISFGII